ncbi:Nucleotide-binding, alpha-beta plait containing protein [Cricetulus griseus]|uniref:Nucleotide-binding, alpha-beta plait containing protein n=2 Tax=Cricetulus griseus TaxID=10029 RepID=A0A061I0A3_CRIGR|nr:Nucleotide-binding, alpha-beta plait containing protein [Cricetulus griseus]
MGNSSSEETQNLLQPGQCTGKSQLRWFPLIATHFRISKTKVSKTMSYSDPLPNVKGMTSLKVDNLANHTSSSTLKRLFEEYGPVGDVYIAPNHLTEERYGFAFIHFLNKHDAKNAMDALNGILLDGCKLRVQMMHKDDPRYTQSDSTQGGQHQYEEDNHESQSQSHTRSSPDNSQNGTQSHYVHRGLSSTKGSKSKFLPRSRNLPQVKGKEDPLHDMLPSDIDSNQPTTFEQHEVMADEEQRECQSWEETSLNKSQGYNFMEGESVNDNYENPGPTHDHLYFARLLGEQNMNKQRKVENAGSNSMFKGPHMSEGNATDTLMEGTSARSQTRRRRNPDNRRERTRVESRAKPSDVVHSGVSERGQHTSFQQSEERRQMEIAESGSRKTKHRRNTSNAISGRMRSTFNNENLNPQNEHALVSGLRSHVCSGNRQKQIDNHRPKSTFTTKGITEISVGDTLNRERECTISVNPEVGTVREVTESRLPQPTQQVALAEAHYIESDESSSDLEFAEPCLLCRLQARFPLSGEFNISRMPISSFSSSPRREHTETTDHRVLSTSVTPTDKEHTNISSDSGETDTQNSKIVSVPQTSNTCLDSTIASAPCGTSGQTTTEDVEGELDDGIDSNLEACDSNSSENSRVNHGDNSVPTSTTISHPARHTGIIYSLVSVPRPGPPFLPTFVVQESRVANVLPTNVPRFRPLPSSISLFGTMPNTQFTNDEDSDDSDSWPTLPDFADFNDIHNNYPKGLTKEQIQSLPLRAFTENDQLSACSICLTEYTESSKIRVLTCCHEYHDECIDPWLSENSTCPVCRRQIINPPSTEIQF